MNDFQKTRQNIDELSAMLPAIYDNIKRVLEFESETMREFNLKNHVLISLEDCKDNIMDFLAYNKVKLSKIAKDFIKDQEAMAKDNN